jgi:biotin-dependent carboxylase-like uncharacterized protein
MKESTNLNSPPMIEVLRPGLFTTIQDLGRFGYRSVGVPVSGPMDSDSSKCANELLGNDQNCPVIEMAFVGASFLFHHSATVAYAGADCEILLNDERVNDRAIINIESGSVLSFGPLTYGNFGYLAVFGGFHAARILGSACYFAAVTGIARMTKGTTVPFDQSIQNKSINTNQKSPILSLPDDIITVEKGPEFHHLSEQEIHLLTTKEFTISRQSNRMGYQLNERVAFGIREIISSPVQPGTVQLTHGGQLIVLMRDAQTIGGYPRILQLTESSLNKIAQLALNTSIQFRIVNNSSS